MYKVLRDYTHPITGLAIKAGETISLNCKISIRMLTKANVIKKVE